MIILAATTLQQQLYSRRGVEALSTVHGMQRTLVLSHSLMLLVQSFIQLTRREHESK